MFSQTASFGKFVAINSDGTVVAVGGKIGTVYVYRRSGSAWTYVAITTTEQAQWMPSLNYTGDLLAFGPLNGSNVFLYRYSETSWSTIFNIMPSGGPSNFHTVLSGGGTSFIIGNPVQRYANVYRVSGFTWDKLDLSDLPAASSYKVALASDGLTATVTSPANTRVFTGAPIIPGNMSASSVVLNTTSGPQTFTASQGGGGDAIAWTTSTNGVPTTLPPFTTVQSYTDSLITYVVGQNIALKSNTLISTATNSEGSASTPQYTVSSNCSPVLTRQYTSGSVIDTTSQNTFTISQTSNAYNVAWTVTKQTELPVQVSNVNSDTRVIFNIPAGITFKSNSFTVTGTTTPGGTASSSFSYSSNSTPILTNPGDKTFYTLPTSFTVSKSSTNNAYGISWSNTWNSGTTLPSSMTITSITDSGITYSVDSSASFTTTPMTVTAMTSVGYNTVAFNVSTYSAEVPVDINGTGTISLVYTLNQSPGVGITFINDSYYVGKGGAIYTNSGITPPTPNSAWGPLASDGVKWLYYIDGNFIKAFDTLNPGNTPITLATPEGSPVFFTFRNMKIHKEYLYTLEAVGSSYLYKWDLTSMQATRITNSYGFPPCNDLAFDSNDRLYIVGDYAEPGFYYIDSNGSTWSGDKTFVSAGSNSFWGISCDVNNTIYASVNAQNSIVKLVPETSTTWSRTTYSYSGLVHNLRCYIYKSILYILDYNNLNIWKLT